MSQKNKANRSLALLRSSASTARVLNLHWIKERHGASIDHGAHPMFQLPRLNEAIIIKHTLRQSERELVNIVRSNATKVVLPFSTSDLKLGGYSAFVEQEGFRQNLAQLLGVSTSNAKFQRDYEVLQELATLPSLDPYLMRERFHRLGHKVASCYFEISEADVEKLEADASEEINRLVHLAYGEQQGPAAKALATKLARLLLTDESSESLAPLRDTLRLSEEEHEAGMFGWKGFLYYKWLVSSLRRHFKPVAQEILSIRVAGAEPADMSYLNGVRRQIVENFSTRIQQVERALQSYDSAFATLTQDGKPSAFRNFLLQAPQMFIDTGEHLASVTHITNFWRYRFPENQPKKLTVEEAYDLFREFASSLDAGQSIIAQAS